MRNPTLNLVLAALTGGLAWLAVFAGATSIASYWAHGSVARHIPSWGMMVALLLASAIGALISLRISGTRSMRAVVPVVLLLGSVVYEHLHDGTEPLIMALSGLVGAALGAGLARLLPPRRARQQAV